MNANVYFRPGDWGYSSDEWGIRFDNREDAQTLADVLIGLPTEQYNKIARLHADLERALHKA